MRKTSKTPLIYALEPRLLFDGDLGADVASSIVYRDGNGESAPAVAPENQRENVRADSVSQGFAVVIIDGALNDYETLVNAAPEDAEVHIINGEADGFEQIAALLENHENIDELHIFGHGLAGEARLGTASLSLPTLTTHSDTLAVLKNALSEEGDILLYGCDIAAGEEGQTFIEELAELTAADIAASEDVTGAGGDWELEASTGSIEAETIVASDYQHSLTPNGVTSLTNTVDRTQSNLIVKARPDFSRSERNSGRGFYDQTSAGRFVIALEKENITSADTLYFDFNVAATNGFTVNAQNPVNSYLIALNDDIGRRDSGQATIVFEYEILGYYADKYNTLGSGAMQRYSENAFSGQGDGDSRVTQISNSYFANSSWTYPTSQIGKRDSEGYFNTAFGNGASGGADYVWTTNNNTLKFAAKNGDGSGTGDFIRVITRASVPNSAPTVTSATDVSGSVTELADGHADENTATLTDTGYFTIDDSDGDTVSVSTAFSSTTHSNNSAFGDLTPTIADNTTTDGTGQINWTYSVDDSALDALDAGESYTETWVITINDGTASTTQNVTVTINGAADPVLAAQDDFASVNEGETVTADTLSGVLHTTDTASQDTGDNLSVQSFRTGNIEGQGTSQAVGNALAGTYGSLTLNHNGNYSYTANSAIAGLGDGDTVYDYFNYTAVDSLGNTDTAVLRITISGQNTAPTMTSDTLLYTVDEADDAAAQALSATGTITLSDDDATNLSVSSYQTLASTVTLGGGLTSIPSALQTALEADNALSISHNTGDTTATWTFNVAAQDLDFLKYGETITVEETIEINDNQGGSITETLRVVIQGRDDKPTSANVVRTINENETYTFLESDFTRLDIDGGTQAFDLEIEAPTNGTLRVNGSVISSGGVATVPFDDLFTDAITFTPDTGASGQNYSALTFRIASDQIDQDVALGDGSDVSQDYTFTFHVNDTPISSDKTVRVNERNIERSSVFTPENTIKVFSVDDFAFTDDEDANFTSIRISRATGDDTLQYSSDAGTTYSRVTDGLIISHADITSGLLRFTPNDDNAADYSFDFEVADSEASFSTTQTMTIEVNSAPDVSATWDTPTLEAGASSSDYTLFSDSPSNTDSDDLASVLRVSGAAAGNDNALITDGTGVGSSVAGTYGTLTISETGTFSYTADATNTLPAGGANGRDTFEIFMRDDEGDDANGAGSHAYGLHVVTFDVEPSENLAPTVSTAAIDPAIIEDVDASAQVLNASGTITFADDGALTIRGADSTSVTPGAGVTIPTLAMQIALEAPLSITDNGDGTADWTLNTAGLDLDFLAAGQTITLDYVVTATDAERLSVDSTITVTITGTNDAPTSADNTVTFTEDIIGAFANGDFGFSDIDGDSRTHITIRSLPDKGYLTLNGARLLDAHLPATVGNIPTLRFVPPNNENGDTYTSFTFTVNDGTVDSASTYTMTIDVTPRNDAPVAVNDTGNVSVGTQFTGFVLDNSTMGGVDTDVDTNDTLVASALGSTTIADSAGATATAVGTYGTLVLGRDGSVTYDADQAAAAALNYGDAAVTDSFTYTLSDGTETDTATITFSITAPDPGNTAPTVSTIDLNKTEDDTAFDIDLINDATPFDADSDTVSLSGDVTLSFVDKDGNSVSLPAGAASVNGATLSIDPSVFNGLDTSENVVITANYSVTDGSAIVANTATITVTGVNDAPAVVAIDDTKTEDEAAFTTDLTAGQTDPDGDTLSVSGTPTITAVDGNGDSVTLPDGAASVTGDDLTVDPTLFNELDDGESVVITVAYDVSDGDTTTPNTATITVTGVNDAPAVVAIDDTKTEDDAAFTTVLTAGQTDPDGDTLSVTGTPTITAVDGNGNSVTLPDGAASVTGDDLTVDPTLFNELDDGESVVITVAYDVSDGDTTTPNTATITVTGVNDAPTVSALTDAKTKNDADYSFSLLQGAADVDGDTLSVVGEPSYVFVDAAGNETSLPADAVKFENDGLFISPGVFSDLGTSDSVTITATFDVTDGDETVQNTATITVTGDNMPPEIIDDRGTPGEGDDRTGTAAIVTDEDTPHNFQADDFNYSDADNDPLDHITIVSLPESGSLFLNDQPVTAGQQIAAGDIDGLSFVPGPNESGPEYTSFVYSVSDGVTDSANGTMTVQVDPINDAPTSENGNLTLQGDDEIDLQRDDFAFVDIDGDAFDHVAITSLPAAGSLTYQGQPVQVGDYIPANRISRLTYEPDEGATGADYDSFGFTVSDGVDDSPVYTMSIGVNAVPQVQGDPIELPEDIVGGYRGTLTGSDAEGGPLTYRITEQPQNGTIELINDGPDYIFTPNEHYYGPDQFEFTASDDDGATSEPAKVDVNVTPVNDRPVLRYVIDDINLMVEQKLKANITSFFGEIDAFDPQDNRFARNISDLFDKGKFPEKRQSDQIPPEGQLSFDVSGLPEGLVFDGQKITGSTTEAGSHDVIIRATDGVGAFRETVITINVAMPVIEKIIDAKPEEIIEREDIKNEEEKPDLEDHDLPPMLKVNPKRDGNVPVREAMAETTSPLVETTITEIGDSAGLDGDSWMKGPVSTEQDVSGNIRVVDLKVDGGEIAVQLTDEAVDRAETFKGEMADGSALPSWIKVDPDTGLTTAEPPSNAAPIEMRVIAEDTAGNARAIDLVLNPDALKEDAKAEETTTREERREARQERREARQAERLERQEAREERREARQAERQARIEAREERRAENRAAKEILRSDTSVNVLADGRVQFSEGLIVSDEASIKLMRMVTDTASVTIEIEDEGQSGATRYEVRQKDGSEAPEWVDVNAATGELIISAPDNPENIELTLIAIDETGQRSIDLELDLDEMLEEAADEEAVEGEEAEEVLSSDELEAIEPSPLGSFQPLDAQIDAALTENSYGRDIQVAFAHRG